MIAGEACRVFALVVCSRHVPTYLDDPKHLEKLHFRLLFEGLGLSDEEEHKLWGWLADNVPYREVKELVEKVRTDEYVRAAL